MSRGRRAYPLLFAAFPVLGVATGNPGYYRLSDAFVLALIAAVGAALALALVYVVLRRWLGSERAGDAAALVTFLGVVVFYAYGPLPLGDIKRWAAGHVALSILALALLAGALWLVYARRWYPRLHQLGAVGRFLTLAGTILVLGSVWRIGWYTVSSRRAIAHSAVVQELARPIPVRPDVDSAPRRDVYVIVLDEYAGADVLRERFGFDNRPFEDSLRALGFRVPASVRSNYANTLMSVSSLLNFAQLDRLSTDLSPDSKDFGPAAYLLEHNRAERFLRRRGYTFVFFPSSWYAPTRTNADADSLFQPYSGFDLSRALYRSELAAYFGRSTLFSKLLPRLRPYTVVDADYARRVFAGVAALARDTASTFALVHVLQPHIPYIYDRDCRPLPAGAELQYGSSPGGRAALADELRCLNAQVLQTVRTIIAESPTPPIIIIQGDHGTQSLKLFESDGLPTVAQARERFRAFGAYYLPDGGAAAIPDSITIVNVLRYVFGYYYGADLPPLPNTMYYSHWKRPYRLTPLDDDFSATATRADVSR